MLSLNSKVERHLKCIQRAIKPLRDDASSQRDDLSVLFKHIFQCCNDASHNLCEERIDCLNTRSLSCAPFLECIYNQHDITLSAQDREGFKGRFNFLAAKDREAEKRIIRYNTLESRIASIIFFSIIIKNNLVGRSQEEKKDLIDIMVSASDCLLDIDKLSTTFNHSKIIVTLTYFLLFKANNGAIGFSNLIQLLNNVLMQCRKINLDSEHESQSPQLLQFIQLLPISDRRQLVDLLPRSECGDSPQSYPYYQAPQPPQSPELPQLSQLFQLSQLSSNLPQAPLLFSAISESSLPQMLNLDSEKLSLPELVLNEKSAKSLQLPQCQSGKTTRYEY